MESSWYAHLDAKATFMKTNTTFLLIAIALLLAAGATAFVFHPKSGRDAVTAVDEPKQVPTEAPKPVISDQKIQVAILLDVSNSMDGLIEQAKGQLWNMVNTIGRAKCGDNNNPPRIEIALYEYGRSSNDPQLGYVKKLNGFISDLDSISQNLFTHYHERRRRVLRTGDPNVCPRACVER